MLKPTKHYEELRQALEAYRLDDYATLQICVAHALLDIRIWAESMGIGDNFWRALRKSNELAHERALGELEEMGEIDP